MVAAEALQRTRDCSDGLPHRVPAVPAETAQMSLDDALAYGQQLELDYKDDKRPEIATHLRRTFSVVAYEDPLNVAGEVGKIAGQESRNALATEMNEAILGMFFGCLLITPTDEIHRGTGKANSTRPRTYLPANKFLFGATWLDGRW